MYISLDLTAEYNFKIQKYLSLSLSLSLSLLFREKKNSFQKFCLLFTGLLKISFSRQASCLRNSKN